MARLNNKVKNRSSLRNNQNELAEANYELQWTSLIVAILTLMVTIAGVVIQLI